MTISDAQFERWLKSDAAGYTMLAHAKFGYESGGAPAVGTLYLSTRKYETRSTDAPANQAHYAVIASDEFGRAINVEKLGGPGMQSARAIELDNADGRVDFVGDLIVAGYDIEIYVGDKEWAFSDFRLVNRSVMERVSSGEMTLTINLRAKTYGLDKTIVGTTIATGPNAGKPKPILLGVVKNFDISPYLLDGAQLTYYVNDFALSGDIDLLLDVREGGLSLRNETLFSFTSATMTANAGSDTLHFVGHTLSINDVVVFGTETGGSIFAGLSMGTQYWVIASGFGPDDFKLSLTKAGAAVDVTGTVMTGTLFADRRRYYFTPATAVLELSSQPVARVTIDLWVIDAGGVMGAGMPHGVFRFVLQTYTALAPAEYDIDAINALYSDELTHGVTYGRAILDRTNVRVVLDDIADTALSWYCPNVSGVLTVGKLDLANLDAVSAVDEISDDDIAEGGELAFENLSLQFGKIIFDADRNTVVQSDGLLGAVSATERARYSQQFQTRVSTTDPGTTGYLANWWDYHPAAIDSDPVSSGLSSISSSSAQAQVICDARTQLFEPFTKVYRCPVGIEKYARNPGDCITLRHPRFGCAAGVKVRVMSVNASFSGRTCELVMVRRTRPDYLTASH
jgi:hypothetical protein